MFQRTNLNFLFNLQRHLRFHYAWVIFAVAFMTLLGAAGFRSAPGVLVDPLREEFGWSRSVVGGAISLNVLLFGFVGPFAAALQVRYGLRRVTMTALAVISIGALATTQMSSAWHLYLLWGLVVGTGSGCLATVFASSVAARWFVEKRGIVTGALAAASASGQLIFLPTLTRLAENHGWQAVGLTIALSTACVLPLVGIFLKNSPTDIGNVPYGAPIDYVAPENITSPIRNALNTLRDAKADKIFWLLFGSFMVCGMSTNGLIQTHFISAAHDHDFGATTAANYLILIGIFDVVGTMASGVLTDRYDPARLLVIYYGLRGVSLIFLEPAISNGGFGLVGFMMFYGLDWVATVPPTVALCIRQFGIQRGPITYGWVFAGHQIGAALAAWGAGIIRETTGSYSLAFVISGIACALAAYGAWLLMSRPDDELKNDPTPSLT